MRSIPSIQTMNPDQILRKKPFRVPLPSIGSEFGQKSTAGISLVNLDGVKYVECTQAEFLRQYYPSSHKINSLKYYPNSIFKDMSEGKLRAKVHTRAAVAYQQMIKTKRKVAILGNEVGMRLITNRAKQAGNDLLARFREGWEETNMEIAIDRGIDSDFTVADVAVYLYIDNGAEGGVGWRVFSYLNGDTLYPHYNPMTGEIALLGRHYMQEDEDGNKTEYLDVIDNTHYAIYRLDFADGKRNWKLESTERHGFNTCPVAYHRSVGPVWCASQDGIENYEIGISQFCEYNSAYGLGILFTCGAEFSIDTDNDGTPLHLDSPDADAKASFINPTPGGADSAYAKQLEILDKNIMRCSFVQHAPEIKSGSDMSGLTVKMLNADPYYKALEDAQEYQLFIDRIVRLFKFAYGMQNNLESEFKDFKIKAYLDPFYFLSETEIVNALVQLTSIGALSRRSATEIAYNSGYGVADEWQRVQQQEHDDLVAESAASQQSERQNPVAESRNQQQ